MNAWRMAARSASSSVGMPTTLASHSAPRSRKDFFFQRSSAPETCVAKVSIAACEPLSNFSNTAFCKFPRRVSTLALVLA